MYKLMRILVLSCILFLTTCFWGCQNPNVSTKDRKNVESMLQNLKKYETDVLITFTKNKDKSNIKMNQLYREDGTYKTTILEPERLKGYYTTYDGHTMSEYNPSTQKTIQTKPSPVLNQLLFGTFLQEYRQSPVEEVEGTLTLEIPGGFKYMATKKVWFDEETKYPTKMEIYDTEGNLTIAIVFENFKYN